MVHLEVGLKEDTDACKNTRVEDFILRTSDGSVINATLLSYSGVSVSPITSFTSL